MSISTVVAPNMAGQRIPSSAVAYLSWFMVADLTFAIAAYSLLIHYSDLRAVANPIPENGLLSIANTALLLAGITVLLCGLLPLQWTGQFPPTEKTDVSSSPALYTDHLNKSLFQKGLIRNAGQLLLISWAMYLCASFNQMFSGAQLAVLMMISVTMVTFAMVRVLYMVYMIKRAYTN